MNFLDDSAEHSADSAPYTSLSTLSLPPPHLAITSLQADTKGRVIEAGHYYQCKGPTAWSEVGLAVAQKIRQPGDKLMLFIDDVHVLSDMQDHEVSLPTLPLDLPADFIELESNASSSAFHFLDLLKDISPRKKRARLEHGRWYCSGFPLTDPSGKPLCVLYDAGLTLRKQHLGFQSGVNILPKFYEQEQLNLKRLLRKGLPEFDLSVILFDLNGDYWSLSDV